MIMRMKERRSQIWKKMRCKDGELYFDCPGGGVRKTGIYDLDSLVEMARGREDRRGDGDK